MPSTELIRNFSIIAHIDHGKSTLSDRIIEICGGLSDREMTTQILDSMDIERERGITIKSQSVSLRYRHSNGKEYQLNLIDTPGHVDFSYEVSRSLAACEGALLVVDATQGVEAQSVANCYTAIDQGLTVLPVINKIDMVQADPDKVCNEIENIIGIDATDAVHCSAKVGTGVGELIEHLIAVIPPPAPSANNALQCLIIDSWFDSYLGVIIFIRVFGGSINKKDKIKIVSTNQVYTVEGIGTFTPKPTKRNTLATGSVGYIITGIKDILFAPVGDTIVASSDSTTTALPGFEVVKPQIYSGLYTIDSQHYEHLRDALQKLSLNDASLQFEPETSDALGFGFRCGFLGLLHLDIIQERLEREYNLELISTAPTVNYKVIDKNQVVTEISSPSKLPEPHQIIEMQEPMCEANMLLPKEFLGKVMSLCIERRGVQKNLQFIGNQVALRFELPMAEVVMDFFDKLKSNTKGYGSLDYNFTHYQAAPLIKLDILINGDKVDSLAMIINRDQAQKKGRQIADKLKELIPRQMFDVAIQASIGNHIIARTTVKALRKNVLAKCYGGDITRKKKLLEKQKAGKKRMKRIGTVDVPQAAFLSILSND